MLLVLQESGIHGRIKSPEDIRGFFVPLGEEHFEAYPIKPFDRNVELQKEITNPM